MRHSVHLMAGQRQMSLFFITYHSFKEIFIIFSLSFLKKVRKTNFSHNFFVILPLWINERLTSSQGFPSYLSPQSMFVKVVPITDKKCALKGCLNIHEISFWKQPEHKKLLMCKAFEKFSNGNVSLDSSNWVLF